MKKEILNLGKNLSKLELTSVLGGCFIPGGLTPPPQCNGQACLEPFNEPDCTALGIFIWHEGRCWSCA